MQSTMDEPSGTDMTDTDTLKLCASQHTTKSSKGRKLRQVLQKKQLDVLLQTYSSYIDEPDESKAYTSNDVFSINRKNSIEGHFEPSAPTSSTPIVIKITEPERSRSRDYPIARMRMSKSLIPDEDENTNYTTETHMQTSPPTSDDEESVDDDAVINSRNIKNKLPKETSRSRRNKKKQAPKRKTRGDLRTRLSKANDVVRGFSTRAAQKHLEIAADFQEATKEIRHHLKSGANIVFEDLADHFDGMVENLFVSENEQRDDDYGRQSRRRQQRGLPSSSSQRQGSSEREGSNIHPLSHDETIEVMNKQVAQLLKPVANLSGKVQENLHCVGRSEGSDLGPPQTAASF